MGLESHAHNSYQGFFLYTCKIQFSPLVNKAKTATVTFVFMISLHALFLLLLFSTPGQQMLVATCKIFLHLGEGVSLLSLILDPITVWITEHPSLSLLDSNKLQILPTLSPPKGNRKYQNALFFKLQ